MIYEHLHQGTGGRDRAGQLCRDHEAVALKAAPASLAEVPFGKTLVCVVHDRHDAAVVCASEFELLDWRENRKEHSADRTWLLLDSAWAEKNLVGY